MTKSKRWPNNAEWARLDAIAAAQKAIELLHPVRQQTTELGTLEIVRRTAEAMDKMSLIIGRLNEVAK